MLATESSDEHHGRDDHDPSDHPPAGWIDPVAEEPDAGQPRVEPAVEHHREEEAASRRVVQPRQQHGQGDPNRHVRDYRPVELNILRFHVDGLLAVILCYYKGLIWYLFDNLLYLFVLLLRYLN